MLSVCCVSGGPPGRLAALLGFLRPVADELVVAVDDRVDPRQLAAVRDLADVLVAYPYAEPVERSFGWLHSLCQGDWVFRIDDDEVPSAGLLGVLAAPDEALTHVWFPRRWLWGGGWLDADPWAPDWQLRLLRPAAARFPGRMHIPVQADGPHAYVEAPLYHLDLVLNDRARREEKARRYAALRRGLRLGGVPLNVAYYVPELRGDAAQLPLPAEDEAFVRSVLEAPIAPTGGPVELRTATREEVDAHWSERPLAESDYAARIEVARPPSPVAGEARTVDVRVSNLGGAVWPGGVDGLPEIRLSYWWRGADAEQTRTPLPSDVASGDTVLVPLSFRAPDEPGRHVLAVDLVHERHRWFSVETEVEVLVRPRRRALVCVGQPPGDAAFDAQVDRLLAELDPALEPALLGPKPEWLRDRFGLDAFAEAPPWKPDAVFVVPAGRRRDRLRQRLLARRLRRNARG